MFSRTIERALLVIGLVLGFIYVGSLVYRTVGSRLAIQSLGISRQRGETGQGQKTNANSGPGGVDQRLWSEKRVAGYLESLASEFEPPLAVLRIPALDIEAPVFDGTDELRLNRGVGRIEGTARPGQRGNIGIAGHRDGFFRGLKDVAVGHTLTLTTPQETATYVVDRITTVSPDDVSVLAETTTPAVTLVTCYPFYFIGHAPQRYIVRCLLRERHSNNTPARNLRNQPVPPAGASYRGPTPVVSPAMLVTWSPRRPSEPATRKAQAAEGAPIVFGLIGLSVAASALSVWLIRRFSSRPNSAVLSQAARTPHQVASFQHPHA